MANKGAAGFNLSFIMELEDGGKSLKDASKMTKQLEKDVQRLEKIENAYEASQREINKLLKAGNITKQQSNQLNLKLSRDYRKLTGDGERYNNMLRKQRAEQAKLNKEKAKSGISAGLSGAAQGLAGRAGLSSLGLSGGALAAGAGVGAAVLGGKAFVDYARAATEHQRILEGQARMLGLTTTSLNGVTFALSRLGSVSEESVVDSLADVRERIAEAAEDAGSALGKSAAAIGLNAKALQGARVPEQLKAIVDSLNGLETPEERLFRARELFGDEAAKLLLTMQQDQERYSELVKKGESRAQMSPESMDAMRKFGDSVADLRIGLAKVFQPAVDKFAKFAGHIADSMDMNNRLTDKLSNIQRIEMLARESGVSLPAMPRSMMTWAQRQPLAGTGRGYSRSGPDNMTEGRGYSEKLDSWYSQWLLGDSTANKNYERELMARLNVLEAEMPELYERVMGKAISSSSGSTTQETSDDDKPERDTKVLKSLMSKIDQDLQVYKDQERVNQLASGHKKMEAAYAGLSSESMRKMAELELQFEKNLATLRGTVGTTEQDLDQLRSKQVEIAKLEYERLKNAEAAAKVAKEEAELKSKMDKGQALLRSLGAGEKDVFDIIMEKNKANKEQIDAFLGERVAGQSGGIAGAGQEYAFLAAQQNEIQERKIQEALDKKRNQLLQQNTDRTIRAIKQQTKALTAKKNNEMVAV